MKPGKNMIPLPMSARFMQSLLSADRWKQFTDEATEQLHINFGSLLEFTTQVNFAVGVKKGETLKPSLTVIS